MEKGLNEQIPIPGPVAEYLLKTLEIEFPIGVLLCRPAQLDRWLGPNKAEGIYVVDNK